MGNLIARCRPDVSVCSFVPPVFSFLLCLFLLTSTKLYGQTFERILNSPVTTDRGGSMSAAWGDFDNDGYLDLYVANSVQKADDPDKNDDHKNYLYRNNGDGTFIKISKGEIVTDAAYSTACSWGDYDNDSDLDLFVANGRNEYRGNVNTCSFYRNSGDGTFTPITNIAMVTEISDARGCSWGDYDNDGDLDLFVTNASNQNNFLFRNNGDGTFMKITTDAIVNDGGDSRGCAWADYDNDGDLDLFVANAGNQNNFFYENNGDGTFTKITTSVIVTDGGNSQGGSWADFDNDGDLDLFVTNYGQNNFLYRNNGDGTFTRITNQIDPIVATDDSRGCMWADYDNDGDLDLFVANFSETDIGRDFLYKNLLNQKSVGGNHWINLRGVGTNSNRSAIGTKIRVKAMINGKWVWQMNEISGQTGFGAQNSLNAEFGLGDAAVIDSIKIEWPSRQVSILASVPANQFLAIEETDIPPSPPQKLKAPVSIGKVILSWEANTENDLLLYHIYGGTAANPTIKVGVVDRMANPTITFTDVIAGQQYYYRVTAVDKAGHESIYSREVSVTIPKAFLRVTTGTVVTDTAFSVGSSWADYDNDGDQDLYVTNGRIPFLFITASPSNNFFYENKGAGNFERITNSVIMNDTTISCSSTWGDYDNDGDLDLFVATAFDPDRNKRKDFLFRNNGDKTFTKIQDNSVGREEQDTISSSWIDYDNDGDLDLFVTNYRNRPALNFLYQNQGKGVFERITEGTIVTAGDRAFGQCWGDYDNDSAMDVFIAHYQHNRNSLLHNLGKGNFEEVRNSPVVTDLGYSMGSNWVDYDNDGNLDLFVTNVGNLLGELPTKYVNFLYNNNAKGEFTRVLNSAVVADSGYFTTSDWADYDNDGDLDLYVATLDGIPNLLFENNGRGEFTKVISEPVAQDSLSSSNCTWADYDNDGDLDLFVATFIKPLLFDKPIDFNAFRPDRNVLYENLAIYPGGGNGNNWIQIKCIGVISNRSAIGAKVRVFAKIKSQPVQQLRQISGQTSSLGQSSLIAAFGLGDATMIDSIRVEWPSGIVRRLANVEVNQFLEVLEARPPIIEHKSISSAIEKQTIIIPATIRDDDRVETAQLFYRQGGESAFTDTTMFSNGDLYQGIISATEVGDKGIEYYILATDIHCLTDTMPPSGFYSVQIEVDEPGITKQDAQPFGSVRDAYRLLSIPIDVENSNILVVLGDDLGEYKKSRWRFFALKRDQGYAEFPDEPASKFEQGKAYWLLVKDAGKVIDTGAGKSNAISTEFAINLHPKWNFIGNPFNFPIPVKNTRFKLNQQWVPQFHYFEGNWNNIISAPVDILKPFEGYAVFNDTTLDDALLINPNLSFSSSEFPKENVLCRENILWSIGIHAQCQDALDEDNLAAIVSGASSSWDELDQPEPPVIGEYVSVYFPHPEWGKLAKIYCTDFRPESSEGHVWPFEVKTNIRDKVNLTFEGVDKVPKELEVWSVDDALQITQNLRETNRYAVAAHPRQLKLVVGKRGFVDEKLMEARAIPTTYELSQNFPNPFNPATTIRYGLPSAERVTLKIYNLLGAEVVTLVDDEQKAAGYHVAIWAGRDSAGRAVTSGVYFIRLRAGNFVQTRKMLLLE